MFRKITRIDELVQREIPAKSTSSALIEISQSGEHGLRNYSYLGPTLHFKGDITLDENLRIEGKVEGTLRITGKKLSIGKQAVVMAEIHAGTVEVHGKVEGDIHGNELVHIRSTAVVNGTIDCARIVIEDGARFNGKIEMRKQETKSSDAKSTVTRIKTDVASSHK